MNISLPGRARDATGLEALLGQKEEEMFERFARVYEGEGTKSSSIGATLD